MSVKNKFNLFVLLYFIAWCSIGGFVAVFLKSKGVSNSLIGIVTASGCVSSIFLAPYLSSVVTKSPKLTIKNLLSLVLILLMAVFAIINFIPVPTIVIVAAYIFINAILVSTGQFLQTLASSYMQVGYDVNFGFARGLGSTSWAVASLALGFLIDLFSTKVLGISFIIFSLITLLLLNSMPNVSTVQGGKKKGGSPFGVAKKYKIYFLLLIGYAFCLSAASSLGTYLINIVTSLGGSESFYGVAMFIMALSEMPVMAITPWLMKKFKSIDLVCIAGLCYVLRNYIICLAPNLPFLCVGFIFQGLSFGLISTVITYYVIFNIDVEDHVMAQTLITMITSGVGSTVGNLLGGFLQDMFGLNGMYILVYSFTTIGFLIIMYAKTLSKKQQYKSEIKR